MATTKEIIDEFISRPEEIENASGTRVRNQRLKDLVDALRYKDEVDERASGRNPIDTIMAMTKKARPPGAA